MKAKGLVSLAAGLGAGYVGEMLREKRRERAKAKPAGSNRVPDEELGAGAPVPESGRVPDEDLGAGAPSSIEEDRSVGLADGGLVGRRHGNFNYGKKG